MALAGGLLTAAADALGAGGLGTPPEALLWAAAGWAFALAFEAPAAALAIGLFVGVLDLAGLGQGSTGAAGHGGDPLALSVAGAAVPALAVVVLGTLCAWSRRLGAHPRATPAALAGSLAIAVAAGGPVVAVLAGVFLVLDARRLVAGVGSTDDG